MPRLRVIEPENAQGKAKELFEGPLKGKELNIFKGMANSPAATEAYLGMGEALSKGELSGKEREVVQLAIGQGNGCEYCVAAHTMLGKQQGLSDDQATGARQGNIGDDPKLNALATFARTIHEKKGWLDDADIQAFKDAGYDDAHIVEVVAGVAQAFFSNYFNHINQTDVDLPEPAGV